ncbi:MAG: CDP-alcohol phosphatidyltransferase family protein [Prevotella sp.]
MFKKDIKHTYKSQDTEEWLDRVWTRPIGYRLALLFKCLNVHPNVVTALSMVVGAGSALFFVHGSCHYEGEAGLLFNLLAIAMLAFANFLDSTDGQLARMTGQKTQLGRILDGAASEVWFIPIYISIVIRFYHHHAVEFSWLGIADTSVNVANATAIAMALVCYSGFGSHSSQCALADYYRQIHLFFLKGREGSELDSSRQQQILYDKTPWKGNRLWKAFLWTYVGYTRRQERRTPQFQRLMQTLACRYGSPSAIPQTFRYRFRNLSYPLLKYTNILTFNTRAIVLYTLCLLDTPMLYFLFEIVVLGLLCRYMRCRHEQMCRELNSLLG